MGRSPRRNRDGGRDHYPNLTTLAFAGGGLKMGQVIGASDARGEYPKTAPIRPQHMMATLYQVLGIDPATTIPDDIAVQRHALAPRQGKSKQKVKIRSSTASRQFRFKGSMCMSRTPGVIS